MTSKKKDCMFPFSSIDDEEFKCIVTTYCGGEHKQPMHKNLENLNLINFDPREHKMHDFGNDIDPDNHFYNIINDTCKYYTDDQFKQIEMEGAFSVIHFNSRSLYKNYNKIEKYLWQFSKFSVVAVSETWLEQEKGYNVEMNGYELFTLDRKNKRAGGVAIYVDTGLRWFVVPSLSTNVDGIMECLTIEIDVVEAKNIIISCVYRTPGSCINTFNQNLESIFGTINNKIHLVCGDYNLDLLNPHRNTKILDFINTMYSNSLFPLITKPSRITTETATLIDNIFTNSIDNDITAGLLINDITDHLPVFGIFQHLKKKENNTTMHKQKLTRYRTPGAIAALGVDLSAQSWGEVYAIEDPDQAYEAFLSTFLNLYDKHCPIRPVTNKNKTRQNKPWITKGLENASKKKNLLYKLYMKHRTRDAESRYKTYKNKLTGIIRIKKKEYYHELLEQHRSDSQGTWKILNGIIKKGKAKVDYPNHFIKDNKTIKEPLEMVNEFNNFFVNVGPSLAKQIVEPSETTSLDESNIKQNTNSMFIKSVHESEILAIVNKLKNKRSTDHTNLDMSLIKEIINSIVTPLTHICNQSFKTGIFPNKMKTAKIIPIFKSGDKYQFTNYRPISLLSQFSKILEKLFVARLDNFIEKHHLLSNHQYGFRANRSTSMAVMELVEKISTAIDEKQYTIGVFIDLRKAFDTIHHKLLLKKLQRYGIRGTANDWLRSYLSERTQYVHMNGVDSLEQTITYGVPQGSVLGPKLFIMYINDVCNILQKMSCVLFADDTSLCCSGRDLGRLLDTVQHELTVLKKWFDANKLSLNISKTKFILFGNRSINREVKIKIDNVEIEQVSENKFLGVIIDNKLNWKSHINNTRSKISKTIAIMYKTKPFLNQNSLYMLYSSLILPYISYCVEVWGNNYKTITNPIFLLQKKAIRIATQSDYHAPSNPLFIKLNTLKFQEIVELNTAIVMYKAHNHLLPCCIQELFRPRESRYNLRGIAIYEKTHARVNIKGRCVSVRGVNLWNSLEKELKNCVSLNSFKKMYKIKKINKYKTLV